MTVAVESLWRVGIVLRLAIPKKSCAGAGRAGGGARDCVFDVEHAGTAGVSSQVNDCEGRARVFHVER